MLNVIDQFTQECLTIRIGRTLKVVDMIDTLADQFILRAHNLLQCFLPNCFSALLLTDLDSNFASALPSLIIVRRYVKF